MNMTKRQKHGAGSNSTRLPSKIQNAGDRPEKARVQTHTRQGADSTSEVNTKPAKQSTDKNLSVAGVVLSELMLLLSTYSN